MTPFYTGDIGTSGSRGIRGADRNAASLLDAIYRDGSEPSEASIILPDVAVSLIEQLLVGVKLVFEQGATEFFLHETFALGRVLPVGEPHLFTMSSMSATMRSTMMWVFLPLASLNNSVRASLARFRSSTGSTCFSASTTSFACSSCSARKFLKTQYRKMNLEREQADSSISPIGNCTSLDPESPRDRIKEELINVSFFTGLLLTSSVQKLPSFCEENNAVQKPTAF